MSDEPPQVIIIAGPNGAGKTTLAPFLLRERFRTSAFVNADAIASGLSAFDPENVAIEAGRIMLRKLHELSEQNRGLLLKLHWLRDHMRHGSSDYGLQVMRCICYLFRSAPPNWRLKEWQSECDAVDT